MLELLTVILFFACVIVGLVFLGMRLHGYETKKQRMERYEVEYKIGRKCR